MLAELSRFTEDLSPDSHLESHLDNPYQLSLPLPTTSGLDAALESVRRDDRNKWDAPVFRHDLFLENGKLTLPPFYDGVPDTSGYPRLTPSQWAWSQLCQRLGMPAHYFRKCPSRLQDIQFNYWIKQPRETKPESGEGQDAEKGDEGQPTPPHLRRQEQDKPERWLLRGKGEGVRAVLSDKYAPLDNNVLLTSLIPVMRRGLQVKHFTLTEESLHLRLIDTTLTKEIFPDDPLFVGIHVGNSEVGKRAVTVDALVYRLICTNGLIGLVKGKSLLYRRHIGGTGAELKGRLEQAIGEALLAGAGLLERLAWSAKTPLSNPEKRIERIASQWHLSEAMQQRITQNLLASPTAHQETVYGLVNAVTLASQSLDPDERYGLEVMAATLLERH